MSQNRSMIVIPARLQSTRLPRKMLLAETGKPLIQHTYEAACRASKPEKVMVATDHEDILRAVEGFGGEARMTDPNAPSGTDRVAEIAEQYPEFSLIVNVQGDEPEIEPQAIDMALEALEQDEKAVMSTLATPTRRREVLEDPACVKVVFDKHYNALYFSRSPIPFARDGLDEKLLVEPPLFHLHVGLYCYRSEFLRQLRTLPVSEYESVERLEQLRVLHHGFRIKTAIIPDSRPGIDTPEDYESFVKRYQC